MTVLVVFFFTYFSHISLVMAIFCPPEFNKLFSPVAEEFLQDQDADTCVGPLAYVRCIQPEEGFLFGEVTFVDMCDVIVRMKTNCLIYRVRAEPKANFFIGGGGW